MLKSLLFFIALLIFITFLIGRFGGGSVPIVPESQFAQTECVDGKTKTIGLNIYTCIQGEWVYTGQIGDIKG